jgi:hypothetical protein
MMDAQERKRKNQQNAAKSTGPHDTQQTRFNGVRHGLTATHLTDLDDRKRLMHLRATLGEELQPTGTLESFVVDRIALTLVRCDRANRLEAEYIQEQLHPPKYGSTPFERTFAELPCNEARPLLDPGVPAELKTDAVGALCDIYGRYETAIEKRLFRYIEQLESLQEARKCS